MPFQEKVELLWDTEEGKTNPISLILLSPVLLKLFASTCSLCAPGQDWNTVASLSEALLAQCRTQCSGQSLPCRSVPQQLALSPLRLEWCQIPPLCHMSLHGWDRKSRADTWTKPKREKNIFGSLWVMTTNPCEPGRRFSHVDKLFWKSH